MPTSVRALESIRILSLALNLPGPDVISVGALTHSAPAVDMSLRIVPA